MKHLSIKKTVDAFPDLTPFERQVLFFESLRQMNPVKYMEVLKVHFKKQK